MVYIKIHGELKQGNTRITWCLQRYAVNKV